MELEIEPEPSAEERAAIQAVLEEVTAPAAELPSRWGRPELEQETADDATGA